MPMCALIDAFRTTAAPRERRGTAFWIVKKAPLRLVAIVSSKNSSVTSSNGTNRPMPALTNRASIRPNLSLIRAIAAAISGTRDMSALITRTSGPSSFCAAFRVVSVRPVIATFAPSRTNAFAAARPMPLLPPVTTATLSLNLWLIMGSCMSSVQCGMSWPSHSRLAVVQVACQTPGQGDPNVDHVDTASVPSERQTSQGNGPTVRYRTTARKQSAADQREPRGADGDFDARSDGSLAEGHRPG